MITAEENINWVNKNNGFELDFLRSPLFNQIETVERYLNENSKILKSFNDETTVLMNDYENELNATMTFLSFKRKVKQKKGWFWFFYTWQEVEVDDASVYQAITDKQLDDLYIKIDGIIKKSLSKKNTTIQNHIDNTNDLVNQYDKLIQIIGDTIQHYNDIDRNNRDNAKLLTYLTDLQTQCDKMILVKQNLTQLMIAIDQLNLLIDSSINRGREVLNFILSVKQAKSLNNFEHLINQFNKK